jgi:uncharacterized protein YvpB
MKKKFYTLTLLCICSVSLSLTLTSCGTANQASVAAGTTASAASTTGTPSSGSLYAAAGAASENTSRAASAETTGETAMMEAGDASENPEERIAAAADSAADENTFQDSSDITPEAGTAAAVISGVPAAPAAVSQETAGNRTQASVSASETPAAESGTAGVSETPETVPTAYNTVLYDARQNRYLVYGSDGSAAPLGKTVLPVSRYIDQVAEGAPMGCEGASLLMALWSKGYCTDMSYQQFLTTMPYASDDNPNHGFVGTPYANDGNFDGINMPAVASWGARYASTADITGCSEEDLIYQLYLGHPVVVWTSYKFGPTEPEDYWWGSYKTNAHVMLLCGFNPDTREFYIADPAPGGSSSGMVWVSWDTFTSSFDVMRGAVAVW